MADKVEIRILVDNYIDIFLPPSDAASYPVPGEASQLWAEQGFSLWIEVSKKGQSIKILYDFGRSNQVLLRNAEILGLDLRRLDFLVLSHGHVDHYGCLSQVLKKTGKRCKLIIHPDAYGRKRYIRLKDGSYIGPWELDRKIIEEFSSRVCVSAHPSDLGFGVYVSGGIRRKNDFEVGMPNAFVEIDGQIVHDEIQDDQSIFIELESKGIVVLTGCCHAGVVNTLMYAREMFPRQRIYALIGGLHLNNISETQMQQTINCLSQLGISYLSGLHCTGYYAQRILMQEFNEAWIPGAVGAKITFVSN
ncbi:MAG: hypothetical protein DRG83_09570 [Deltaproteobacteria bacterium]|nr:MAG: hypothetical protein DRG83_09570 [Deltaproteobacteria bacterium]